MRLYLEGEHTGAMCLLAVAALSDMLDGFIARRFNMVSDWGKFIDPVADKVSQAALVICLAIRQPITLILLGAFALKEVVQTIAVARLFFKTGKKPDGALWWGKASTMVFYCFTVLMVAIPALPQWLVVTMVCISSAFLLRALAAYLVLFSRLRKEYEAEQANK